MDVHIEVVGYYKFEAVKLDGTRRDLTGWCTNLVLDSGLDIMGTASPVMSRCHVGGGNTPPVVSDTALETIIATTTSVQSDTSGVAATTPYYAYNRRVYRFPVGSATGTLAEVGVSNGGSLFSRALILDGVGDPTTITILADELLDVTYEIRHYVPTVDGGGTFDIDAVTYTWVSRAGYANTPASSTGWSMQDAGFVTIVALREGATLNAVTADLSFTGSVSTSSGTIDAYTPGTYERTMTFGADIDTANFVDGISGLSIRMGIGYYQFTISPAIPKKDTEVFTISLKHSWQRKT